MIYGYARVSTHTQDFKGQVDTLEAEGCQTVYFEKVTGTKTDRPEFNQLLHVLKAGDTLKVTTLDRLARNTEEGISVIKTLLKKGVKVHVLNVGYIEDTAMGNFFIQTLLAVAELERNMIVERTQEGKAMARLDPNFREGRPRKYSKDQIAHAIALKETHTYSQVEGKTGISKSTLIRARRRQGLI